MTVNNYTLVFLANFELTTVYQFKNTYNNLDGFENCRLSSFTFMLVNSIV